ncbi:M50 family metallopeptidase [Treponema socranskii]|uniref:M50 family metallopeptidase n=1 Tax=Treponema socranskii TaxID=53419 RepID=UPI002871F44A|nr:site-2 protease family protein [Treponema socranskii]MDR9859707.1 site-2 protease family protein [Treponema socranskii]
MKWIYGIVCLGFLVFFHELGHFLAAKLFGVKVESFSLGFGPALLHKTIGGTDYRLSLLPLGGYCGMKGEGDFQAALDASSPRIEAERDSLYGINPLGRALIGFAGPFFNALFAFTAFSIIAMTGYTYYSYTAKIKLADETLPEVHSPARKAGLKTGDTIVSIGGKPVEDFSDIIREVASNPDRDLHIVVLRNGEEISYIVHSDFDKSTGSGKIGVTPFSNEPIMREAKRYPFFKALVEGIKRTGETLSLTVKSIALLFKGADVQNAISGPVGVAGMLGNTVEDGFGAGFRQGITAILELMAFISISLFIMNLLPIPVLDGALIFFAFVEFVCRRPLNPKIQYYAQYAGLAIIASLFVLGMTSDIRHLTAALRSH